MNFSCSSNLLRAIQSWVTASGCYIYLWQSISLNSYTSSIRNIVLIHISKHTRVLLTPPLSWNTSGWGKWRSSSSHLFWSLFEFGWSFPSNARRFCPESISTCDCRTFSPAWADLLLSRGQRVSLLILAAWFRDAFWCLVPHLFATDSWEENKIIFQATERWALRIWKSKILNLISLPLYFIRVNVDPECYITA